MLEQTARTPMIDTPGIAVADEGPIAVRSCEPIWIDAVALFPSSAEVDPRYWCRSLFVTCIGEVDQSPLVVNLLKDRVVAPDVTSCCDLGGEPALRLPLHFELARELGVKLAKATYHVQISARHYRSRIVSLIVE